MDEIRSIKKTLASLVLGSALAISGCDQSQSPVGNVYEKNYEPSRTEVAVVPTFDGDDISLSLETKLIPEKFIIKLKDNYDSKESKEIEVSKKEYNSINIGDLYGVESLK